MEIALSKSNFPIDCAMALCMLKDLSTKHLGNLHICETCNILV